jgi:DNA-binding MurR/RpiR family transcriptional regulator
MVGSTGRTNQEAAVDVRSAGVSRLGEQLTGLRLPPTQRRVVRYITSHPQEAALLSSTDLAERIGVSQATVTRVAVALGYAGFAELRGELRRMLYDGQPDPGIQPVVQKSIENLQALHGLLEDPGPLERAALLLASSSPLPVLATRISEPLGRYLGYRLERCHPDVRLIDRGDSIGADRLASAAHAGASALLCVNLPRHAAETLAMLELARDLDLRIVMITDHASAPGTSYAELAFAIPVGTGLVFDSHAAPTVFASILADAVADADGSTGQGHLEILEELAGKRGTFVD